MYTYLTRAAIHQCDDQGLLTLVSAIDILQGCTQFWMESEPALVSYMQQNQIVILLAFRQVDILGRACHGTHLKVETSVYECKGFYGYRNTAIYGTDGTPYVKSWCVGVFIDTCSGRPVRIPQPILDTICYDPPLEMEYLPKKIHTPKDILVAGEALAANKLDIDFNRHVNNARYVDMACRHLPDYERYDRLRIEYKKAAKLDDQIIPHCGTTQTGDTIMQLCNDTLQPYCTMEFSNPKKA